VSYVVALANLRRSADLFFVRRETTMLKRFEEVHLQTTDCRLKANNHDYMKNLDLELLINTVREQKLLSIIYFSRLSFTDNIGHTSRKVLSRITSHSASFAT
jgi:hypothetical protein